ncbi:uncharacterized protein ACNS7B_014921 [Menidia menidia]
MRTWLLVALLLSDLSPPGDGHWITDGLRRRIPDKLLLLILTQAGSNCENFQRHGRAAGGRNHPRRIHRETEGIFHWTRFLTLAVSSSYKEGKHVPAFLVRSNTLLALHVSSEMSHVAMDIIKRGPDLWSAWVLHRFSTSGHNFPALLLEKSKGRAPVAVVGLQETLIKRYCTAAGVIISCCAEDGGTEAALNIEIASKQEVSRPRVKQNPGNRRAAMKVPLQNTAPCFFICRQRILQTTLKSPDSSSWENSDKLQLEIQQHVLSVVKKNEHVDKDSDSKEVLQKQLSLKASNEDSDGFYAQRPVPLASGESKGPINRSQNGKRPSQDDTNVCFGVFQIKIRGNSQLGFIINPDKSKFKRLRDGKQCFQLQAMESVEIMGLRRADPTAEPSTTEKAERPETDQTRVGEEISSPEESTTATPLSLRPQTAAAPATNTATQTTSPPEVFSPAGAGTADPRPRKDQSPTTTMPKPRAATEPRLIKYATEKSIQTTTRNLLSGLRMREDIPAVVKKLGEGSETGATANWGKSEGKDDEKDPGKTIIGPPKSSGAVYKEALNSPLKTTAVSRPLCRGLIHRTEAGRKHCMDRLQLPASRSFLGNDAPDGLRDEPTRDQQGPSIVNADDSGHFYYFDGVLKRVWRSFYPYHERQRRQSDIRNS